MKEKIDWSKTRIFEKVEHIIYIKTNETISRPREIDSRNNKRI
jgi:hypothetical protein